MVSLIEHIRKLARVLAEELPAGRGISDKAVQDKYRKTLEAIPEDEREESLKDAIKDIQEIIKDKEVPEDLAELYPKWKVGDFSEYMKYLKGSKTLEDIEKEEEPKKNPGESSSGGVDPEKVRLFFMAPDNPSTKTLTPEGNFQWVGYELLFKKDGKHYKYQTPLWAYGEEASGDQSILEFDLNSKELTETKDFSIDQAKNLLKKYRTIYPEGLSGFYYNVPEQFAKGKVNIDQWARYGKKYTYGDFDKKFRKSGFYKVVGKDKELQNP